ncbi:hypothetical protein V491_03600 [Pseudogymnoascus sp. VKM F-3775]|nr:hypothetical protein V491_03600 [Pseudogymnoascus sp. VKM F-3775]
MKVTALIAFVLATVAVASPIADAELAKRKKLLIKKEDKKSCFALFIPIFADIFQSSQDLVLATVARWRPHLAARLAGETAPALPLATPSNMQHARGTIARLE